MNTAKSQTSSGRQMPGTVQSGQWRSQIAQLSRDSLFSVIAQKKKKKKITLEDVVVMGKFVDHTLQMEQKEITQENRERWGLISISQYISQNEIEIPWS